MKRFSIFIAIYLLPLVALAASGSYTGGGPFNKNGSSGGGSGVAIGSAVSGGHAHDALFIDGAGKLGQDDNYTYNNGVLNAAQFNGINDASIVLSVGNNVAVAYDQGNASVGLGDGTDGVIGVPYSTSLGQSSGAASHSVSVGAAATSGYRSIAIGSQTTSSDTAEGGIAIGTNAYTSDGGIAIGNDIEADQYQMVIGSNTQRIHEAWIGGNNWTYASPPDLLLHPGDVAPLYGVDLPGANFVINGGMGSGAGTPGNLIFKVAKPGSTGFGAQTLYTALTINNNTLQSYFVGNISIPHLIGSSSTPTIAAGAGSGTGPTVSVSGSDLGGTITITTGTAPTPSATVATVTYAVAYGSAPRGITLTPANSAAAALSGLTSAYVDSASTSTTVFVIKSLSTGLAGSTTYKFAYHIDQ